VGVLHDENGGPNPREGSEGTAETKKKIGSKGENEKKKKKAKLDKKSLIQKKRSEVAFLKDKNLQTRTSESPQQNVGQTPLLSAVRAKRGLKREGSQVCDVFEQEKKGGRERVKKKLGVQCWRHPKQ